MSQMRYSEQSRKLLELGKWDAIFLPQKQGVKASAICTLLIRRSLESSPTQQHGSQFHQRTFYKMSTLSSQAQKEHAASMEARLSFLRSSADHFALVAPVTSSFLSAQTPRLLAKLDDNSKFKKQYQKSRHSCAACGNLFVPVATYRATIETSTSQRHHKNTFKRVQARPPKKVQITECLKCNSVVRLPVDPPPSFRSKARSRTQEAEVSTLDSAPAKAKSIVPILKSTSKPGPSKSMDATPMETVALKPNKSAKDRAKARKKGGLQAQLDKSKTNSSTGGGFGLDLMDFMSNG